MPRNKKLAIPGVLHEKYKQSRDKVKAIKRKYRGARNDMDPSNPYPNMTCHVNRVELLRTERSFLKDYFRAFCKDYQEMRRTFFHFLEFE